MKKRVAAAMLWFYVTWYAWAILAQAAGFPVLAGPVLGAAVAALIAGDPMHRIWNRGTESAASPSTTPAGVRQTA